MLGAKLVWTLAALVLAIALSPPARAEAPAGEADDDTLPEGALFRLGTNRFRQQGEIWQVRYSPDGKKMATTSGDTAIIWDAGNGRQLKRLRHRRDVESGPTLTALAFSPDGEQIAAAGTFSHLSIWEVDTGLELLSFPIQSRTSSRVMIRYSPVGERLALVTDSNVVLFDMATGTQTRELTNEAQRAQFTDICWSQDGAHFLASTLEPAAVAWDAESGKLVRRFEAKKERVFSTSITISADGQTLVAATGGILHFWRFADGQHLKDVELDAKYIHTLDLTPDSKTLIAGSQEGMIYVVDVETGKVQRKIDSRLWIARSFAVSPDFKTVAIGAVYPTIRQLDIKTGDELFPELTAAGHDAEVDCVIWSPDGHLIASGGANRQINLWDAETGKLRLKVASPSSANRMAFSPLGRHLITSWQSTGMIRIWDVDSGKEVCTIESGKKNVQAFALTRDGKRLVSVVVDSLNSSPSTLQVWDIETGEKLRESALNAGRLRSVVLTGNGMSLITGSSDGLIRVFDVESGNEQALLPGHAHSVDSLAISSDGTLLASASDDQTIRLWDTRKWKSVRVLRGHERAVTSLAFSPDGRILASGSGRKSDPRYPEHSQRIRLWDVRSGEQIGAFSGDNANTSAVAFSPNGRRLVSAHDNTTLLVWDVSPFDKR
jgi:WD40 repeat protein